MRSLRTEVRYQLWGRSVFLAVGGLTVSLVFAFTGSISNVTARLARLQVTEAQALGNGVTLADAMGHPSNVVVQGGQRMLDNPVRFDYEAAYFAYRALEAPYAVGTGLEMITFLVIPLLFFVYGCGTAVGDIRQRILKDRIVIEGPEPYIAAKVAAVVLVSFGATMLAALLSFGAAPLLKALFLPDLSREFQYAVDDSGVGNPAVQVAFSAGVAVLFGLLGLFIGLVARSMLIPSLAAGGLLMLMPFTWSYDPRNILTAAGEGVFNYWGGFKPRPPLPVETTFGLGMLCGGLVLVALISIAVWSRMSKFI